MTPYFNQSHIITAILVLRYRDLRGVLHEITPRKTIQWSGYVLTAVVTLSRMSGHTRRGWVGYTKFLGVMYWFAKWDNS